MDLKVGDTLKENSSSGVFSVQSISAVSVQSCPSEKRVPVNVVLPAAKQVNYLMLLTVPIDVSLKSQLVS